MQLSVWIVTYNHENFIEQCLNSALEQEVDFDYEIIVGEDCSTDSTAERLKTIENRNPDRVRVIYNESNIGGRANLYKTLAACKGEYVAFLEGDDYWTSKDKLKLQVEFLRNNERASCVFHRTRAISAADPKIECVIPASDPPEFSSYDFLLQDSNPIAVSSLVARRAYLADINTWLADIKPGDWLLCMLLAAQGDLGFIPLEMSHYRVHEAGYWTRLSAHHRVATTIRMLRHASLLVPDKFKALVEDRAFQLAVWWSSELVHNGDLAPDKIARELDAIGDCQLSNYLLARLVSVARSAREAELWHRDQAKAWQESAQSVAQTASLISNIAQSGEWHLLRWMRRSMERLTDRSGHKAN